ncbi:MAG: indole-3-glycerol phosphate synthase TrpC [Candidatus Methylomirabilales bacterium]
MTILDRILDRTRAEVEVRKAQTPLARLEAACAAAPPPRDLAAAIRRASGTPRRQGPIRVIAEVKKASPSRGVIRENFDPVALAQEYEKAGAHAISVLTDAPFFHGSLADLSAVRGAVGLPLLRKDFHVEAYQLWEARAAGADAVLLIVATLEDAALRDLLALARRLSLTALVEVHTGDELARALAAGAPVLGINNRNLATFEVALDTTFALLPRVPPDRVLVSESGIATAEDVRRLADAGADAVLVGEGLLRHADVGAGLRRLASAP